MLNWGAETLVGGGKVPIRVERRRVGVGGADMSWIGGGGRSL